MVGAMVGSSEGRNHPVDQIECQLLPETDDGRDREREKLGPTYLD